MMRETACVQSVQQYPDNGVSHFGVFVVFLEFAFASACLLASRGRVEGCLVTLTLLPSCNINFGYTACGCPVLSRTVLYHRCVNQLRACSNATGVYCLAWRHGRGSAEERSGVRVEPGQEVPSLGRLV